MKKIHSITKIRDVKGFTMLVEFDGSDVRAIDLSKLIKLRSTFKKLRNPKFFSNFEITPKGSITWTHEIEITGPTLYHMGDDSDQDRLE